MPERDLANLTCHYRICSERAPYGQERRQIFYGIEAISDVEPAMVYHAILSISSDRAQVEEMVQKFNTYRLSPLHLSDAVEDMMR